MNGRKRWIIIGAGLALLLPFLAAGFSQETDAQSPASRPATESTSLIPTTEVPFYADWASSPHADHSALPFNHWNKERAIPVTCAKCHSTPGFRDFLGADGTEPGVVNHPAPIGTVITCVACHNAKSVDLTSVVFPSGLKVDHLGSSAICMSCHQGRESTASVNKAVAGIGDDTVDPKLKFIDPHYLAAGATLMGNQARGAYQYPQKTYAGRLVHPAPYNTCTSCHNLHTVAVKVEACAACHKQVTDLASLRLIRVSKIDYDGSGNPNEGVAQEITNISNQLYATIQSYAKTVSHKPIVYDGKVYPYFFVDTNGNGVPDQNGTHFPNRYNAWTPRLLKAAYNYLFFAKEPGAFAHNPKYTIQILYDSIADLSAKVHVNIAKLKRP